MSISFGFMVCQIYPVYVFSDQGICTCQVHGRCQVQDIVLATSMILLYAVKAICLKSVFDYMSVPFTY